MNTVSIEDKGCYNYGPTQELSSSNNNNTNFEFHRGNGKGRASQHRTALGKPTPSKWDDAQKWLVGLSRSSERNQSKTQPRNSNADDRRLIAPVPQVENGYSSGEDERKEESVFSDSGNGIHYEIETKKVDCDESVWRSNKQMENSRPAVKSICLRDMGTDMTPIASQEPSRAATPIRTRTPANQSPIRSEHSTPARAQNGVQGIDSYQTGPMSTESRDESLPSGRESGKTGRSNRNGDAFDASKNTNADQERKLSPLETRAMAWDEAERAKYMARYKREEIKIEAWENHEKRKAEMEMKRMEVKAERMKSRAQEKLANKLAATRRIAEEKRTNAEAKLSEQAARTSEMADYIRRTGRLPSLFSFKLPSCRSCCW